MTSILRDFTIACVFFCLVSNVYAQNDILAETVNKPFVLNANEVPVIGGLLNIYGLNFGNDPSVISVYIYDNDPTSSSDNGAHIIECVDVKIVLVNSIISCSVNEIGTGKAKHIEVIVKGISNAGTEDINIAFRRSAPLLKGISYDDSSLIRVYGQHFGFNPLVVSVTIDGYQHLVRSVNDSVITCDKHADYKLPTDDSITTSTVSVVVDHQKSETNMTFFMESGSNTMTANSIQDQGFSIHLDTTKMIMIALIPGVAGVVILIGFLLIRRRLSAASSTGLVSTPSDVEKAESHAVITGGSLVKANSMEEIDLTSDNDRKSASTNTVSKDAQAPVLRPGACSPSIYELNRTTSSSSESSFSSPYSSSNSTPTFGTPDSMRRMASPTLDTSNFADAAHSNRRSKREKMSSMIGEPISRLGKRSMDSPYFTKQNPFDSPNVNCTPVDSPLRGSVDGSGSPANAISPSDSPSILKNSQEINQLHKNPFDSPSVLHSAIQRAALLRASQQPQKPRKHTKLPHSLHKKRAAAGRRSSLSGVPQNATRGRRSSLGAISLHVSALRSSASDEQSSDDCEYEYDNEVDQKPHPSMSSLRSSQFIPRIQEEEEDEVLSDQ